MQELALQPELGGTTVRWVARYGQVDRGQVDADLVGAAGLERHAEESVARKQFLDVEPRYGVTRIRSVERVPQRIRAVAADRRLDPTRP